MADSKSHEDEYRDRRPHFEAMAGRLQVLISELLKQEGLRLHAVESRAKTVESYVAKINRPSKAYSNPMCEVTDLVGVRILLYYNDDVQTVAQVLQKEFDAHEIIDGQEATLEDVNKFGYVSTHCILSLSAARKGLSEWKSFAEQKFEVQIRTVLQHAWAAISHSLQYKRETDVPALLRRRLNRVAGLFELADAELISIRDSHQQLKAAGGAALLKGNASVAVTVDAVNEFIVTWAGASQLRAAAEAVGFDTDDALVSEYDFLSEIVSNAESIGISSIAQLRKIGETDATEFLKSVRGRQRTAWVVSVAFLLMLQVIRAGTDVITPETLTKENWSLEIARRVVSAAQKHKIEGWR